LRDAELIEKFCRGDAQAFNRVVERWQPRIQAVAYRYFNSHDEAMEMTQKTFIRVYKKASTLDDYRKFKAWIYRIANNLCLDETKRAGRRRSSPVETLRNHPAAKLDGDNPERPLHQKELEAILQKALQQLPPEQRMVIIMKEYQDLTFREIAEILEIPESTVKSRLYYGLQKLRDIFDQWNLNKENLYYE